MTSAITGVTPAAQYWKERVEAHNAQSAKARGDRPDHTDMWSTLAANFKVDPMRTEDAVVNFLLRFARPHKSALDVGGGAGRCALPLALNSKHVTVVEPSPSMASALSDVAGEAGIDNISVLPCRWEDADVDPADVVLCANVVNGVAGIEPFVLKLNASAREVVVVVAHMDAPGSMMSPLWEAVHHEERVELPSVPELLPVLWEVGIFPNLEIVAPETASRAAPTIEVAVQIARVFLFVEPGTAADERLQAAIPNLAVETPNGVTLRRAHTRPQAIVWWRPGEFSA